ncbi:MAG: CDP-6-deoxy-L-threo-D-glycero-4-hexulose-3-dehydrase reductase [Candidatus Dichloromethanomonas elyunquensis]|nr:MAG: CDP-6-deoxy-L-threo-D-glycero-4-hexulose-3-dehydrase reductase [Candidatus Dichloromethanomonas elyunquensis]
MYQVNFLPNNIIIKAEAGENLLDVARRGNILTDFPCNGNGVCGKCRLKIIQGSIDTVKTHHLSGEEAEQGYILACSSRVRGDLTIGLLRSENEESQVMKIESLAEEKSRELLRRAVGVVTQNKMCFGAGIKKEYLELALPTHDDNVADWERLRTHLEKKIGYQEIIGGLSIIRTIPQILRESDFKVTVTHKPKNAESTVIINVEKGNTCDRLYGAAIDIGTTSVAAILVNLLDGHIIAESSAGNVQIKYGADVIHRIVHAVRENGMAELNQAIVQETLNPLLNDICLKANIEKDELSSVVIAGNTTMMHLLLGVYPDFLRKEPYIPGFTGHFLLKSAELALDVNPETPVYIVPAVASFVGGDITGGVLASGLWTVQENTLFLDLGTNGEIVLGNQDYLLTCACSAGPAFEGGGISCGMRATTGAIEKVTIERESFEPNITTIHEVKPLGLCGSGIIDTVAEMFLTGIIDRRGKINKNIHSSRIRFDEYEVGEYVLVFKEDSQIAKDITITEIDLENFIRAKGAVYSAVAVLLSSLGKDFSEIDKIVIAGGIGNNINIVNAITIGLFPDIPLDKYEYIGNSSLMGCYLILTSEDCQTKVQEISAQMTYIELSSNPDYMDEFLSACFFPHTDIEKFPSVRDWQQKNSNSTLF